MVCWHAKHKSHDFPPVVGARGVQVELAVCHAAETCFISNPDNLSATARRDHDHRLWS